MARSWGFLWSALSALTRPGTSLPEDLFDLSSFKLQLPVSNGNGGIVEVSPEDLKTYSSPFFSHNIDSSSVTLWCPVNGAHTSGSKYPRTELRELTDWFADDVGRHELNVTAIVSKSPPSGKIVVGQVHTNGYRGGCSVVLELEWEKSGVLEARLRDSQCQTVSRNVGYGIGLGVQFRYQVIVEHATLRVYTSWEGHKKWSGFYALNESMEYSMFFKVGDYVQDAGIWSSEGGRMELYEVRTHHHFGRTMDT